LCARELDRHVERSRAAGDGHGMPCASEGGEIGLEAVHERAHRGYERRVEAVLEVPPFVAGKPGFVQLHGVTSYHEPNGVDDTATQRRLPHQWTHRLYASGL
jgi:hypothetical protein